MNENMLEILIGKYIDSEITPAEQRLLDHELRTNPQAQTLLEHYQQLDLLTRQAVSDQLDASAPSFDDIFGKAIERYQPQSRWKRLVFSSWLRVPASAAAGFLIGLFSLYAYSQLSLPYNTLDPKSEPPKIAIINKQSTPGATRVTQLVPHHHSPSSRHSRTDWYTFTDPSGARWLLESQRDGDYDLAGYTGDL
jgi:hypothetical protein